MIRWLTVLLLGYSGLLTAQNFQLQQDMKLYQIRCTQCHPIEMARSEVDFVPTDVHSLIERMRVMPGSLMRPNETRRLYQIHLLLTYKNQKEELVEALNALPPSQRKAEIEALKKALAPYK